ncbi:TetR/AcrR family transcriptional regulator [Bradyrhizobium sp.]|uniref:TetR/AcrR family transcriptional regulator n=1 Tax=Bradyrhizobium sp. TaxID=376 RepID=UPI0025C061DF|nr:TetR/AcrR family transcriptional regulator [Bradyrhizobium sp.]MCA3254082.1 TetR family transcriptional regulator [Alphaproteobacteria bacterium]MCA3566511.1 TetR family transcriptional regulator [Bradyrhizobium sp.]
MTAAARCAPAWQLSRKAHGKLRGEAALTGERPKPAPRPRDRDGTEARIIQAAAAIMARDGVGALGVNTVAREAGVDKQLVYRYFGGLEGLLERLGTDLRLWLGDAADAEIAGSGYAEVITGQLVAHLAALRANHLVQAALAWELVERSEAVARLGAAKNEAIRDWFAQVRATAGAPPRGVDATAINAVLLAGMHHLVLRARTAGDFAGMDLTDPASWARIEAAVAHISTAMYAAPAATIDDA